MIRRDSFRNGFSMALGAVILAVILYACWLLLHAVLAIATPFVAAIIVSLLLDPIVIRIQETIGGNRNRAVLIVFLIFLAVFLALFAFLVPTLIAQTSKLVGFFTPVSYAVDRAPEEGGLYTRIAENLSTTNYTAKDLENGETYQFRVVAVDSEGRRHALPTVVVTPHVFRTPRRTDSRPQPTPTPSPTIATPSPTPTPTPTPDSLLPPLDDSANTDEPPDVALPADVTADDGTAAGHPGSHDTSAPTPTPAPTPTTATTPAPGLSPTSTNASGKDAPRPTPGDVKGLQPGAIIAIPGDGQVKLVWKPPDNLQPGFEKLRASVDAWLLSHRRIGPISLPQNIEALQSQYSAQFSRALQDITTRFGNVLIETFSKLLTVVLIPIATLYILMDMNRLRARLLYLIPEEPRNHFLQFAEDVGGAFGGYLRGMFILSTLYGIVATVVYFFAGLKAYALLLGFIAGLLYAIPFFGPAVTLFLVAVVSLATGHTAIHTLLLLVFAFSENFVFDNFLTPRIVGGSVGLHPLTTMFSLFLGGQLFGILGMLFAVPLAASIQATLIRIYPRLGGPIPVSIMLSPHRTEAVETELNPPTLGEEVQKANVEAAEKNEEASAGTADAAPAANDKRDGD